MNKYTQFEFFHFLLLFPSFFFVMVMQCHYHSIFTSTPGMIVAMNQKQKAIIKTIEQWPSATTINKSRNMCSFCIVHSAYDPRSPFTIHKRCKMVKNRKSSEICYTFSLANAIACNIWLYWPLCLEYIVMMTIDRNSLEKVHILPLDIKCVHFWFSLVLTDRKKRVKMDSFWRNSIVFALSLLIVFRNKYRFFIFSNKMRSRFVCAYVSSIEWSFSFLCLSTKTGNDIFCSVRNKTQQ